MIREKIILDNVAGKDVLDIGSTGQTAEYNLYSQIKKVTRTVIGIDIKASNELNVFEGNMENYDFGKVFDIIVAGNVIEHVDNQGLFLANVYKHLKSDGKLILTTSNAKWFTVMAKPNPTHTLWHDRYTLEYILKKNGFRIEKFQYYFGDKPKYNLIQKILIWRQMMIVICTK